MTAYNQGDPRQKVQTCIRCFEATGRCEEDALYCTACVEGPLCEACYFADRHYKENDS